MWGEIELRGVDRGETKTTKIKPNSSPSPPQTQIKAPPPPPAYLHECAWDLQ